MRNRVKKALALLLISCLLISVLPAVSFADGETKKAAILNDVIPDARFTPAAEGDAYLYHGTGKEIIPEPIVRYNDRLLERNKDYTVTCSDTIKLPGEYFISVKGRGNYTGEVNFRLILSPEPVKGLETRLSVAAGGYDDIYVEWDKSEGADGYMLYGRRPSASKSWTYLTRTQDTSFLKKNLPDGWKYEFKVIPYAVINNLRYRTMDKTVSSFITTLKKTTISVKKYNSIRARAEWKKVYGRSKYQLLVEDSERADQYITTGTALNIPIEKHRKMTYRVRAYKLVEKNGRTYRVYAPWSDPFRFTLS